MKCDICGKEILFKKDLIAGPVRRYRNYISISELMGRNIKAYHKSCYKPISFKEQINPSFREKKRPSIWKMSGGYGNFMLIAPALFVILFFSYFRIFPFNVGIYFLVFSLILEIPLIRLRLKIKKEYEDKLQ